MNFIRFSFILLLCFAQLCAQEGDSAKKTTKSAALGMHLYTFGWGFDFQQILKINEKRDHFFRLDLASLKNKNEGRTPSLYRDQGGKAYIFDKKNYCYNLGVTYGQQWAIISRTNVSYVSVHAGISGGVALAILKPYYIEVINSSASRIEVDQYSFSKYTINDIVGESDYFQGFDKLKIQPGLRIKAHFVIELGNSVFLARYIDTGVQIDWFPGEPQIMDQTKNPRLYAALYLGFLIGNKW